VLERALAGEMTEHPGYEKDDRARRGSGNSRNGTRPKTRLTDVGAVDLAVPRCCALIYRMYYFSHLSDDELVSHIMPSGRDINLRAGHQTPAAELPGWR